MKRIKLLFMLAAMWLSGAGLANAAEFHAFTSQAFAAAQAQGRPILVEVHANWCPTCRAQAPVVQSVARSPEFDGLVVFRLDFDRQLTERRALGVRVQSTLIAFHGGRETGRSAGDTDPDAIAALLFTALR
jgi:thiol-disulfide isomerase/thioredoxin